jgi:hypothetical protein
VNARWLIATFHSTCQDKLPAVEFLATPSPFFLLQTFFRGSPRQQRGLQFAGLLRKRHPVNPHIKAARFFDSGEQLGHLPSRHVEAEAGAYLCLLTVPPVDQSGAQRSVAMPSKLITGFLIMTIVIVINIGAELKYRTTAIWGKIKIFTKY